MAKTLHGHLVTVRGRSMKQEQLTKRFRVRCDVATEVDRFRVDLASRLGTKPRLSHLIRACLQLVLEARGEILAVAIPRPKEAKPNNNKPDTIAAFEKRLAAHISEGILARCHKPPGISSSIMPNKQQPPHKGHEAN